MTETLNQFGDALAERYAVERQIGVGGMATVYLARDVKHHRHVALKVLNQDLGAILGVERFLAEINVTANLQHPNLLPLFDSGEAESHGPAGRSSLLYYVMPFVQGESLRALLDREKQLPIDEALRIIGSVAGAVDYAHRQGVIHRDLKPENVLLQDGEPLVADFGIALAVSHAAGNRITQTGLSLGTPSYMSPEQATGDRLIDGRADIYSLGAMLYEMLTGEPPHTGSTAQAIIAKVLTDRPRSIRLSRSTVSTHLEMVVEKALSKLPADRYQTARDFVEDLRRDAVTTGREVAAAQLTPPASRAASRFLIAALVAALALAGVVSLWQWRSSAASAQVIHVPLATSVADGIISGGMAFAPDGNSFAYVANGPDSVSRIYLRTLDELHARAIMGSDRGVWPFFSPDGKEIAFVAGNQLKKVKVTGGAPITLATVEGPTFGGSWVGKKTIVFTGRGGIFTLPSEGGIPTPVKRDSTTPMQSSLRHPLVMPDGVHIILENWRGSSPATELTLFSLKTGELRSLNLKGLEALGVIDGQLLYQDDKEGISAVPFDTRSLKVTGLPVQLVTDTAIVRYAALAANGSLVYWVRQSLTELVLSDSISGPPLISKQARYQRPRFSPNQDRIALSIDTRGSSDIWILNVATKQLERLTAPGSHADNAEWTPDGKVLFSSLRDGATALWMQPVDGSAPARKILAIPNRDVWEGALSHDGKLLAYRTGTISGADTYYRRLDGDSTDHPIAATSASENAPRFSPDGRWVAHGSDASRSGQVYVRPFSNMNSRFQISPDGGSDPFWSHDGRQLYYIRQNMVLRATLQLGADVRVTRLDTVLTGNFERGGGHAPMDVTRDGRKFLFIRVLPSEPQIVLAVGWSKELRRLRKK